MKLEMSGITLREVIKNIKDLVPEVDIKIDKEGLSIITMDPANVAMVIFKLPAKSCMSFEHTEGEDSFGINLSNLSKILKRVKKDDMIKLITTDTKMSLKIGTARAFTIPKIDIEESAQKIPNLKLTSYINLDRKELLDAVEDVNIVANSSVFILTKDTFTVEGEENLMKAKIDFSNLDISIPEDETKIKVKFAIEYLKKMLSAPCEKVKVELGNDKPLMLTFINDAYDLAYMLAPRVSDQDDD